jgi:predicted kinase
MIGSRLFLVCGLPGSGKTTRARQLEQKYNAIRFCPDEWMADLALDLYDEVHREKVEALQWKLAQSLLTHGLAVVIEWGTWGRAERDRLRRGARALGAAVELHYLTAPLDVLYERVQSRGMESPPITREDLFRWSHVFEEPADEELLLFDPPLGNRQTSF